MSEKITLEELKSSFRDVIDFPKEGIVFKDITTALKRPEIFRHLVDELYEKYKDLGITKVVGIESRGFILGAALAYRLGAGFVLVRKEGKLPADTHKKSYALEYGSDTIEVHKDAIDKGETVLVHDDLLATGGTAAATLDLIKVFEPKKVYASFIIELAFLKGKDALGESEELDIFSLVSF
ncbi:adenine phosphoribosyltransferase [Fulvitalea axinellae]|uniref:Adenine phosphoribosyltransferase n=1 Tax=Fulvitalea axinellae TaxID=1182444 RepID=A0AAU9CG35_9BACT|nr:adenine phosphoribosyltransferase [Fulvitalea axinellae]